MNQTKAMLKAIFDDATLPEACAACQTDLAAYIDAELEGQPAADRFPEVTAHLVTCTDCQQAYVELKTLLSAEWQGRLAVPPVAPAFDFSYLPEPTKDAAPRAWRLDELGRLVIQLSGDLLRSVQGPAWQPSYLKSANVPTFDYRLAGELDDLTVHITAKPGHTDPQRVMIEVAVGIPSRGGWPHLAGSLVTLRRATGEVVEVQETDAFGKVVFENVPAEDLPELVFEIEHA